MTKLSIDEITTFCKKKGFVFRSSDIYGGFAGFWDLGPLGVELFNNIQQNWWQYFVHQRENIVGIDASVISHPRTWKASGHIESFKDIAVVCKKCKRSTRVEQSELGKVKCECGGEYESKGKFNLLFKTSVGALNPVEAYLRGETAQSMFMDFKLVTETSRVKLPFGIAQIGRCFRNEIAPRDFVFRSREFTIAEFEFFIHPDEKKCNLLTKKHLNVKLKLLDAKTQERGKDTLKQTTISKMLKEKSLGEWQAYWLAEQIFWLQSIGLTKLKVREHTKDELSHYSSATFDIDYKYPFGSKEVTGIANRGQYDLNQHIKESKQKLYFYDEESKKKVIPRVIEPTFGVERILLAAIVEGYQYDKKRGNIVLKLHPRLAPYKAAVFPLVSNKPKLVKKAKDVYDDLKKDFNVFYDDKGSIGRRYARADETAIPLCCTLDFQTLKDETVTLRNRDDTKQIRVKIKDLKKIIRAFIDGEKFESLGKIVK